MVINHNQNHVRNKRLKYFDTKHKCPNAHKTQPRSFYSHNFRFSGYAPRHNVSFLETCTGNTHIPRYLALTTCPFPFPAKSERAKCVFKFPMSYSEQIMPPNNYLLCASPAAFYNMSGWGHLQYQKLHLPTNLFE